MGTKDKTYNKRLLFETYLAMIRNSIGSKTWKNFYMLFNKKKMDVTENGALSCAFFVSFLLKIFGLAKDIHGTVNATVQDMQALKWYKIKKPQTGCVIVWEGIKYKDKIYRHIGFYIGNDKAVSNSSIKKTPALHHWTFNNKRKVIGIFWNKKLDRWGG